jgi:hypothetical protein
MFKVKSKELTGTLLDFPEELFLFIQDKDFNVVSSGLYSLKDQILQIRDKDLTKDGSGERSLRELLKKYLSEKHRIIINN